MPAVYPGARPNAWPTILSLMTVGCSLGLGFGYFDLLWKTAHSWPSLRHDMSLAAIAFSVFMTVFLNIAYTWASHRFGRPLSTVSLLLFPICKLLSDGFMLLFVFDLGRWIRPYAAGQDISLASFPAGMNALVTKGTDHPTFWIDFVWGFALYTLLHAALHANIAEERILPVHLDLEAPNKFMRAIVVQQFSYIIIYYLTGDVAMYCALRCLGDLLTVIAVRMQPPGAQVAPIPEEAPKDKKA